MVMVTAPRKIILEQHLTRVENECCYVVVRLVNRIEPRVGTHFLQFARHDQLSIHELIHDAEYGKYHGTTVEIIGAARDL